MFFHSQKRYHLILNGHTYVCWNRLSIGTYENTMRPNRKCIKPIWRPKNLKYMFLHSRTRYQRNFKGYNYVFGDRLLIATHENTMRPNRKWIKPTWRPTNLKCMFFHSQKKISANSKRLYLRLLEPAFCWDPREYYATKPEVDKSKIAGKFRFSAWANRSPACDWGQR